MSGLRRIPPRGRPWIMSQLRFRPVTMSTTITKTREGREFETVGDRIVFPTPEHEFGGGVAIADAAASKILTSPESGEFEKYQLCWEWTGENVGTRVGKSKLIEITQTSFGRDRTVIVSLVDIADANLEALQ